MNKIFRSWTGRAVIAGAAVAALALTGCTTSGSSGEASESRLDKIIESGELHVGSTLKFEPQMFKDADGEPAGYDIDLVQQMADDLGVKLVIDDQEFDALIPGLLADQFDLISVGLVNTPERAKTVNFSSPYVPYNQVLVGAADLPASTTISDLNKEGTTITALTGSTAATLAKQQFPKATILELDQQSTLLEVSSGRAAATVVEEYLAGPFIAENASTAHLLNNGEAFATQYGAYAMQKGDQEWLNWVNNWLAYQTGQGFLDAKYAEWIEPTL